MNPVITPVNDHVIFELTDEDRAKLAQVDLVGGAADALDVTMHKMCVMQAITMVTEPDSLDLSSIQSGDDLRHTQGYSDTPICVSSSITKFLQSLNDNIGTRPARNKLKTIVEDVINTCPVRRTERKARGKGPGGWITVVEEVQDLDDQAYQEAEDQRDEILDRVPQSATIAKKLEAVREAAALYRVTKESK